MFFLGGLLFTYIFSLISAVSQLPNDSQQSNDILCSTIKCSTNSVCKVVEGRAECVDDNDETSTPSNEDFCNLPADTGRCRGYIESFYYNAASGSCEKFVYGGCKGNKNRFQTVEQCESVCKRDIGTTPTSSIVENFNNRNSRKAGVCPTIQKSSNSESCEKLCISDYECPDDEKCCSNGCDYLCTKPLTQPTSTCRLIQDSGRWECTVGNEEYYFDTKEACQQSCVGNGGACPENACKDHCEYCVNVPRPCTLPPCPQFTCLRNESCVSGPAAAMDGFVIQSHVRVHQVFLDSNTPGVNTQRVCHLPSETGRCRASLKRFYYTGYECIEFIYGGCRGNENNFETKGACEQRCAGVPPCPKDEAGKAPEGCQWAYALKPDGCQETFLNCTEGPCAENPCKDECEYCINDPKPCDSEPCPQYSCGKKQSCQPKAVIHDSMKEFCLMAPVTGKCRAAFTRWYYNQTINSCETFTYGGCGGNQNRFENKNLCEKICKSSGNPNDKGKVADDVGKLRTCRFPSLPGPCDSFTTRWFYDGTKCAQFQYGGCQGNDNNFETQADCEQLCANVPACSPLVVPNPIPAGCALMPETKPDGCQALTVTCPNAACAVNPCKGECETCVPEDKPCTQTPCQQYRCEKNQTCLNAIVGRNEICQLPPVTGKCRAAFTRWFFNSTSEECEKFVYGGCKGNENRFETLDECKKVCKTPTDSKRILIPEFDKYRACRQHTNVGECQDSIKRWFYDYSECREFTYTGCKGNENNFPTEEECLSRCNGVRPCPVFDAPEKIEGCEIVTYSTPDQCTKYHYKCTKGPCATNPCSSDCENCVNEPKLCKKAPCPQYRCERNETCITSQCQNVVCNANYECDRINATSTCVKRSQEMSCNSKLSVGSCRGRYESYFYDITTGTCNPFTYTGCEGNANRFTSKKSCEEICLANG